MTTPIRMKIAPLVLLLALASSSGFAADTPPASAKPAASAEQTDAFAVGATWHGRRFFHKKDTPKGRGQPWSLHVETRDGDKFTGYIALNGTAAGKTKIAVAGSAPADGAGYVGFATTEDKGEFRQRFTGSMKDGVIELEFKGRSLVDEEVEGTAALSRKKPKD